MILPVILSGGSGTRLWPLSTPAHPKQFLPLLGKESLFQATALRIADLVDVSNPVIVCNQLHKTAVKQELKQLSIKPLQIILEPFGKNTAPAITLAALYAFSLKQNPTLLVMPSDHGIHNINKFQQSVLAGNKLAEQGRLVTFGIEPTYPATDYGYIQAGKAIANSKAFTVQRFVEKPDLERAKQYIKSSHFYWNSGIFMFLASQLLAEIKNCAPDILEQCEKTFSKSIKKSNCITLNAAAFKKCRSESIDYAMMEKTSNTVVLPMDIGWSDLGTWTALYDHCKKDKQGNVIQGNVIAHDATNSFLKATTKKIIALGIKDLIIIETEAGVLVTDKKNSHELKKYL